MTEPMTTGMMTQAEMDEIKERNEAAKCVLDSLPLYFREREAVDSSVNAVPRLLAHIDALTASLATKTAESDMNYREFCRVNAELDAANEALAEKTKESEFIPTGPAGNRTTYMCGACGYTLTYGDNYCKVCGSKMRTGPKHLADAIIPVGIRTLPEVGK